MSYNTIKRLKEYARQLNKLGLIKFANQLNRWIDYTTGVNTSISNAELMSEKYTQLWLDIQKYDTIYHSDIRKVLALTKQALSGYTEVPSYITRSIEIALDNSKEPEQEPVDPPVDPEEPDPEDPIDPEPELPEPLPLPDEPEYSVPDGWVDLDLPSGNLWATNYLRTANHDTIALNDVEYFVLGEPYSKTKCGRNHFKRITPVKFGSNPKDVLYSYYEDADGKFKRPAASDSTYNASNNYVETYTDAGFGDSFPSFSAIKSKDIFELKDGIYLVKDEYDAASHNIGSYAKIPTRLDFTELSRFCRFEYDSSAKQWNVSNEDRSSTISLKVSAYLNGSALTWNIDKDTTQVDDNVGIPGRANEVHLLINELVSVPGQGNQDASVYMCRFSTIENDFSARSADGLGMLIAYSGMPILPVRYDKCDEIIAFREKRIEYSNLVSLKSSLPEKEDPEYTAKVNEYNLLVEAFVN